MTNICVIPARGGSKRIPGKNIKSFFGKPMIAWSINAAQNSDLFDRIIVSTDDPEIALVSKKYGASVPFIRPSELSDDFIGTAPVVNHAISQLVADNLESHDICCLYATAPFVTAELLRKGLHLLRSSSDKSFVFTATEYPYPIQRALKFDALKSSVSMFNPDMYNTRSQDLEPAYHDAGQFYWANAQSWINKKNQFENSIPLLLPRWDVQDIDTESDWHYAEKLFSLKIQHKLQ